jgi:Arc/MetJ family transcription regulator
MATAGRDMEIGTPWYTMKMPTQEGSMRVTIDLDDELLKQAHEMTGIEDRTALIHEALRRLIQLEASRRLAKLGGSDPDAEAPPRRRSPDSEL